MLERIENVLPISRSSIFRIALGKLYKSLLNEEGKVTNPF